MIKNYLKSEHRFKFKLHQTWSFFQRNAEVLLTIIFLIIVFLCTKCYIDGNKKSIENLIRLSDKLITASSVISAILISYMVGKVLQIRQEKLTYFPEYYDLTQKTHFFRNALYILFKSNRYWVGGLKQYIDEVYKELEYYDIRKVVFVNHTKISELGRTFNKDEKYGDTMRLYLALKAFFPETSLFDQTLNIEFNVEKFYHPKRIELWRTFEPSAELYYFFNYKFSFFEGDFNFQNVSKNDQKLALEYAVKIDKERYTKAEFGNVLYDLLGQQFTEDILPRLTKKSQEIHGNLPLSIQYLSIVLSLILAFGVVVPIFNSLYSFNIFFALISLSVVLSVIFYIIIAFKKILKNEMKINV